MLTPSSPLLSRRSLLALAAAPWPAPAAGGFNLGVATYSLRKFDRRRTIAAIRQLGVTCVNVKEYHLPYKSTPAELAAGRKEFEDAGLKIVAGGSVDFEKDDDADVRRYFDYARAAGLPLMVIATTHAILPRIEKFVKEYGIRVAVHNHGPEDKEFPSPDVALKAVKGLDPRVGVCVDVGHTMRTAVDVVESIRACGSRLFDVHIKDLRSAADRKSQCPVGDGIAPTPAIFRQLMKMKYSGLVSLEYEAEPENPLPGMMKSFAYMRGLLAAIKG